MMEFERASVLGSVADVIATTATMGRVMLTAAAHDITHERIGVVEDVEIGQGSARLRGTSHDALIDLSAVAAIVADRTGRMKDRALPRLQILGHDGEVLFGLIALDGLEPFDAALENLAFGEAPAPAPPAPRAETPEIAEDDAAQVMLARAASKPGRATLRFSRPGLVQSWEGKIGAVKPAMGFVNVIQGDFHLHVRAGAIGSWRRQEVGPDLEALDPEGRPTGLVLAHPDALDLD